MSKFAKLYLSIKLWNKTIIALITVSVVVLFGLANYPVSSTIVNGVVIENPKLSLTTFVSIWSEGKGGGLDDGKKYTCQIRLEKSVFIEASCAKDNSKGQSVTVSITESLLPLCSTHRVLPPNK